MVRFPYLYPPLFLRTLPACPPARPQLLAYKEAVDSYQVPDGNWKDVRPYLELAHFNADVIRTKNSAAAGLCGWGASPPQR